MEDLNLNTIIIGIVWTYGIGLSPALVFRFLVFKKPINRIFSILICFIWLCLWSLANLYFNDAIGYGDRLHGGTIIMIIVSYIILSRGYVPKGKEDIIIPRKKPEKSNANLPRNRGQNKA